MTPEQALSSANSRPWPPPDSPWVMSQIWRKLLFAHWPVPAEMVRPLLPAGLALDTWDGQAWLGIVPFQMERVRFRGLPGIPTATRFGELNVRTYVTADDKPGVFFFSLDAGSLLAVLGARALFALPERSRIRATMVAASAAASPAGNSVPVTPSRMSSR